MMSPLPRLVVIAALALLPIVGVTAVAEPAKDLAKEPAKPAASNEPAPTAKAPAPLAAAPVMPVVAGPGPAQPPKAGGLNETQQYCSNIAAAAADARFAWQRKQLTDLQTQLKQRIAELDQKQAEFQAVITKRDDMMKKATETVVGIYSHMKPDAAAAQIAALDDDAAAAILAQLTQQKASVILNEIPTERAAKLVTVISAVTGAKKS